MGDFRAATLARHDPGTVRRVSMHHGCSRTERALVEIGVVSRFRRHIVELAFVPLVGNIADTPLPHLARSSHPEITIVAL